MKILLTQLILLYKRFPALVYTFLSCPRKAEKKNDARTKAWNKARRTLLDKRVDRANGEDMEHKTSQSESCHFTDTA